ncbi:pentapeptide repeat-containing protein [Lentzea sp. NPDC055074]
MGDEQKFPAYRVLSTRAIVWATMGLMVTGVGLAVWLLLAYGSGTDADKARLEAIKTAGTIVVGTGGAAALWLAARRQQTSEIALRQKDKDQTHQERVAAHTESVAATTQAHQERVALQSEHDAAERRVTDLYTKAVEQLGSEKAPVRLGGMYALERLAQNVPGQRQTIVNVLCAYLRMPYLPPTEDDSTADEPETPTASSDGVKGTTAETTRPITGEENRHRQQERQVRLTAQRILATHLRRFNGHSRSADTFWTEIDLDLTGATLLEFDFRDCQIRTASFAAARFNGTAVFSSAGFSGTAEFSGAEFSDVALFDRARFSEDARFVGARFLGAGFTGAGWFNEARFIGAARFNEAQFSWDIWFNGVQFSRDVWFNGAGFSGTARFNEAQFVGAARFSDARFRQNAEFIGSRFAKVAEFSEAGFSGAARFNEAQFSEAAQFSKARFSQDVVFNEARVRIDVSMEIERSWPSDLVVVGPSTKENSHLSNQNGRWGYLRPPSSADAKSAKPQV